MQIGVEFLGQSMPQLIKSTFGAFKVYAYLTVASSIARVFGSAVGGAQVGDDDGAPVAVAGGEVAHGRGPQAISSSAPTALNR